MSTVAAEWYVNSSNYATKEFVCNFYFLISSPPNCFQFHQGEGSIFDGIFDFSGRTDFVHLTTNGQEFLAAFSAVTSRVTVSANL
jgi:hypothetical protein